MQPVFNLRYRKTNFFNKILLTKEGEVILKEDGFTLKGKGANDKGEFMSMQNVKEFYVRESSIMFVTFAKEKYILTHFDSMYDEFVLQFFKMRNQFLSKNLFMQQGDLKFEYEGRYEYINQYNKPMHKGNAKVQIYEGSIVVLPQKKDAFMIPFNFLTSHEFEDMDYSLKCCLEDKSTVMFQQLGTVYEQFEEHFNTIAARMYEKIVNKLKNIFPEFPLGEILKLSNLMKYGKAVSIKQIQKIDKELAQKVEEVLLENESHQKKLAFLKQQTTEENINYGICVLDYEDFEFKSWYLVAMPEKNCVMFEIISDSKHPEKTTFDSYFFQIIMERGSAIDKVKDKVLEINQTMLNLNWALDPFWRDKKDLRSGPYQYAIRKLPYLRILRKSFLAKFTEEDFKVWSEKVELMFEKARPKEHKRRAPKPLVQTA